MAYITYNLDGGRKVVQGVFAGDNAEANADAQVTAKGTTKFPTDIPGADLDPYFEIGGSWLVTTPAEAEVNASVIMQYAGSGLGFRLTWATGETGADGNGWEARTTSGNAVQWNSAQKDIYFPRPMGTGLAYKTLLEAVNSSGRSFDVEYLTGTTDTSDFSSLNSAGKWRPFPDPDPSAWPTFSGGVDARAERSIVTTTPPPLSATELKAERRAECVAAVVQLESEIGGKDIWALNSWFKSLGTAAPTMTGAVNALGAGWTASAARTIGTWWWAMSLKQQYLNHGDSPAGYMNAALHNEGTGLVRTWYSAHKMTVTDASIEVALGSETIDEETLFTSTTAPWIQGMKNRTPYQTDLTTGGWNATTGGSTVTSAAFDDFI